jgi:predicted glycoside hydrolase/deacetylase ChbG (UPF0249 family)
MRDNTANSLASELDGGRRAAYIVLGPELSTPLTFSPRARSELRQELRAQFDKFAATGLRLSHIDEHLHMHVHLVIFRAALELGLRYGVRRMRVPQEEYRLAVNFRRQYTGKKPCIHCFSAYSLAA